MSVMFYYSPEFAAVTDDIEGYISSLVTYANYAYLNSDVNMHARLFKIMRYVQKSSLSLCRFQLSSRCFAFRNMWASSKRRTRTACLLNLHSTEVSTCVRRTAARKTNTSGTWHEEPPNSLSVPNKHISIKKRTANVGIVLFIV